ncbi:MAG: hypothetical protein J6M05_04615, partial [Cardiobacteriaceae bacterium]|nr:hypothetical protein [Cardiobacteriaceae bacterium]
SINFSYKFPWINYKLRSINKVSAIIIKKSRGFAAEIFRLRLKMTVAVSKLPRLIVGKSRNYGEKQKIRRVKNGGFVFANKYK